MTVKELIKILKQFNQEAQVLVTINGEVAIADNIIVTTKTNSLTIKGDMNNK